MTAKPNRWAWVYGGTTASNVYRADSGRLVRSGETGTVNEVYTFDPGPIEIHNLAGTGRCWCIHGPLRGLKAGTPD